MIALFLKEHVLKPAVARFGTVAASFIVLGGNHLCTEFQVCGLVTDSGAAMVVTWLSAAALVLFDFVVQYLHQKGK